MKEKTVQPERAKKAQFIVSRVSVEKTVDCYQINVLENQVEQLVQELIDPLPFSEGPDILAQPSDVVIEIRTSDVTYDHVMRLKEQIEGAGLFIEEIKYY